MNKITIDIDAINQCVKNADGLFLELEAEKNLKILLDTQKKIEEAIKKAKEQIEKTALAIDPNFNSISGDKIKIYYRSFGSRFGIDESMIQYLPENLYSKKTSYSVDAKNVEKHIKETGQIPAGIIEFNRPKTISFSYKGDSNE
jgi:hypothetical protein